MPDPSLFSPSVPAGQLYAEVAFPFPLPRPSHYLVPDDMAADARPGRLVLAPLSRKERIGCIVELSTQPPEGVPALRPLVGWVSPDFEIDPPLIALARWIAGYYLCTGGEALAAVSFIGFTDVNLPRETWISLASDWTKPGSGGDAEESLLKGAPARRRLLGVLRESPKREWPATEALSLARTSRTVLRSLVDTGAVVEAQRPVAWEPENREPVRRDTPQVLTPRQSESYQPVVQALEQRRFAAFLLQGVTGSGKTEIYLQAIQRCLDLGRQALCLVPEIALTPQTLERFQARFGNRIGVCHGRMTRNEKLRLACALRNRDVRVVIGPRSAVFSPVPDLGLLVVDEEHETTYKQNESPRYHARDTGLMRARAANAVVLLGSATPSLESLENARQGKYELLTLPDRIDSRPLPPVEIVDMATELREGHNPSLFSRRMETAIHQRLERSEQTILFLNRRGFANFVLCPNCGHVPRCPNDDVAMTYHRIREAPEKRPQRPGTSDVEDLQQDLFEGLSSSDAVQLRRARGQSSPAPAPNSKRAKSVGPSYLGKNILDTPDEQGRVARLVCHLCSHKVPMPPRCPQCADPRLSVVGQGTQRIEDELAERFPKARILRMDLDTMSRRNAYDAAWRRITQGEVDIILGTQIIAKGLHLERVTLVGVVLADVGLFVPDFRAGERTFGLLTQVAGRTGRSALGGEVIIQTYVPQATPIQCALTHDVEAFAEEELRRRRWLRFPPVTRLAAITLTGKELEPVLETAGGLSGILRRKRHLDIHAGCTVLGPMPAPLSRLRGRWRQRILVRGETPGPLHSLLRDSLDEYESRTFPSSVRVTVDVDPLDLM